MTLDSTVVEDSCPPQPKQIIFKEKRNVSRRQDLKPVSQTNKQMARPDRYGKAEEKKNKPIVFQHIIEADVEMNSVHHVGISDCQKTPSHSDKPCSSCKSSTPQRMRRKACAHTAAATGHVPCPSTYITVPSSPSQTSIISDTAAEELCDLRNYYGEQLRRINYISHEYLGQPTHPGVLACIREPLKSLRLPRGLIIAQTARTLWTRISGRRKLVRC